MRKKPESADVLRKVGELACGKANDAVRLVFLENGDEELLKKMDLSLLSEIKRGANGAIEVKLLNRLDALELLARLVGAGEAPQGHSAETFYQALDETAARIEAHQHEN